MRPYDMREMDLLRAARARAEELRKDWQAANARPPGRPERMPGPRAARLRAARAAAGRGLIAVGRRMLPVEIEPCS